MYSYSPTFLLPLRKLRAILITSMTIALAGCGGGGTPAFTGIAGTVTVLHSFAGGTTDGEQPTGSLIQASDGYLYGTSSYGGTSNGGTVFKIQ